MCCTALVMVFEHHLKTRSFISKPIGKYKMFKLKLKTPCCQSSELRFQDSFSASSFAFHVDLLSVFADRNRVNALGIGSAGFPVPLTFLYRTFAIVAVPWTHSCPTLKFLNFEQIFSSHHNECRRQVNPYFAFQTYQPVIR